MPLSVTDAQRAVLEGWVRRRSTAQFLAQRSRIVLECAEGHAILEVARRLRISPDTVRTWRGRFAGQRLPALCDRKRSGRPASFTPLQSAQVKALAAKVEAECGSAGLEPEARRFNAHLTLARARARDGASLPELPPPPDTVVVFTTELAALLAIFTISVMDGYVAAADSTSLLLQVSGDNVHVQPVPLIAVAVSPAGNVSLTLTVPDVEPWPMLLTGKFRMVNVAGV